MTSATSSASSNERKHHEGNRNHPRTQAKRQVGQGRGDKARSVPKRRVHGTLVLPERPWPYDLRQQVHQEGRQARRLLEDRGMREGLRLQGNVRLSM